MRKSTSRKPKPMQADPDADEGMVLESVPSSTADWSITPNGHNNGHHNEIPAAFSRVNERFEILA